MPDDHTFDDTSRPESVRETPRGRGRLIALAVLTTLGTWWSLGFLLNLGLGMDPRCESVPGPCSANAAAAMVAVFGGWSLLGAATTSWFLMRNRHRDRALAVLNLAIAASVLHILAIPVLMSPR